MQGFRIKVVRDSWILGVNTWRRHTPRPPPRPRRVHQPHRSRSSRATPESRAEGSGIMV